MGRIIAALADRQLKAWQDIALYWAVYAGSDGHVRCQMDEMSIWRTHDDHGDRYVIGSDEIVALTVAHLRNHHPNLDPCEDII